MQMRPGLATLILLCFVITVSSALADSGTERFTVTSTLDGRTVLPLRIHWIAQSAATADNGAVTTTASSVLRRPEGSPARFLSRIVRLLVANRYSEAWKWLDPTDQKLAPEPVYVTCESLTPVRGRLVSLRTLHVGHDRIGVAVRFRLRIADEAQPQETTVLLTAHAVVAPGRWAWILPQARRALYRHGCDLDRPPNP